MQSDNMRSQNDVAPETLGPDSLTWQYFGDWRGLLQGPWAGTMQNMHPKLGAAVSEHSEFFRERWPRLLRSLFPIGGVVYDGEYAARTAGEIRDYHRDIKGVYYSDADAAPKRYHALDPDVFYWAHATFFKGMLLTAEHFMGGLTEAQRRQLFEEHKIWYRLYGVSERAMPQTWEEFQAYWDHMCRDVLEDNAAARGVLDLHDIDKPPFVHWIPEPAWPLLRPFVAHGFVWLTVGLMDPPVREKLGYRWTGIDAGLHRRVGQAVNLGAKFVPRRRLMHPRAQHALDRLAGRIPADAPPRDAPRRYMPPPDQWDDPKHYNPYRTLAPACRSDLF